MADNIAHANTIFYPLYYDIISLTSLKFTQTFHLLLVFAENQVIFRNFIIRNSVWITEGSDNGGPTVHTFVISFLLPKAKAEGNKNDITRIEGI